MNFKNFSWQVDQRIKQINEVLKVKMNQYMRNNNVFHNFERGASITGESREKILDGFLLKHYISYQDMLDDIEEENLPTEEVVKEKFGDLINYFIIQEISIIDKIHKQDEINKTKVRNTF